MKKRNMFIGAITCCAVLLLCTGCEKHSDEAKWEASCRVYVDNLPQEYMDLPEEIKQSTNFSLSLFNASADKSYSFDLEEENGYSEEIDLLPGTYTVSDVYVYNHLLSPIEASVSVQTLTIKQHTETSLVISIADPDNLSMSIEQNTAGQEILSEALYSRKIQYAGTVYDMQTLAQVISFTGQNDESVAHGETAYITSDTHSGIAMIVQNTNENGVLPASQCDCIGFRFSNTNTTLPMGVTVGLPVNRIANAKTGLLGTPDYCLGTPLIGLGIDRTTMVYLDKNSGDRISVYLNASKGYVDAVSYEFNRYQ